MLKEVEAVFEDEPSLDAQDLFLHMPTLKALLESKQQQKELLEKEAAEKEAGEGSAEATPSEPAPAVTESEAKKEEVSVIAKSDDEDDEKDDEKDEDLKLIPPQTLEEVTVELDHFKVLLDYITELFGPT